MTLGREMGRLKHLPVFACLDEDALRLIAFSAEVRHLSPGQVLFRRGDPTGSAVLVASGRLTLDDGGGGPPRVAAAGALLDETALLAVGERAATATAREAASVVPVARDLMLRVVAAYPHNAAALRAYWTGRIAARVAEVRRTVPR